MVCIAGRLELPDKRKSDACNTRSQLDLRIGAAFTRFQTLRFQKMYDALSSKIISYGGCQFPTLGFVVQRHGAFFPRYFLFLYHIFRLYEVVPFHRCVLPYKYRNILEMLPKLMKLCEIMGSRYKAHDEFMPEDFYKIAVKHEVPRLSSRYLLH